MSQGALVASTMSEPHSFGSHGKTDSDLTTSAHSSASSSAERYQLDESDATPILMYRYRGLLQTSSQKDLCAWLDKNEKWRVTRKPIPRYTSYVDVFRHDLFLPDEKEAYHEYPNYYSNLASVKVPSSVYWSRLIFGGYPDLYIVSPESSPNSSFVSEGSRKPSPSATWGADSELDARLGAVEEQQQRQGEEGEEMNRGRRPSSRSS